MRRSRLSVVSAGLAIACLASGCSHTVRPATPSPPAFAQLAGRPGEGARVRITSTNGRTEGTIARLDIDSLTLLTRDGRETFACAQVRRVETRGDAVWTGAVAGAAIGALPAWNGCQNKGRNLTCVALGVGSFAAVGALFDAAHAGWKTIYDASRGSCGAP